MATSVNVSAAWKDVEKIHCKVSGSWKQANAVWVKVAGTWERAFIRTVDISHSGETANIDILTLVETALGATASAPLRVRFTNTGTIYSQRSASELRRAVTAVGLPAGSTLEIINSGNIYGHGGNGRSSGDNAFQRNGGDAIYTEVDTTIINTGSIYGGGGGGGCGAGIRADWTQQIGDNFFPIQDFAGGGGGGGGQGYIGGSGSSQNPSNYDGDSGTNGGVGGPGTRGSSTSVNGASSGRGGNGGSWGSDGQAPGSPDTNPNSGTATITVAERDPGIGGKGIRHSSGVTVTLATAGDILGGVGE